MKPQLLDGETPWVCGDQLRRQRQLSPNGRSTFEYQHQYRRLGVQSGVLEYALRLRQLPASSTIDPASARDRVIDGVRRSGELYVPCPTIETRAVLPG